MSGSETQSQSQSKVSITSASIRRHGEQRSNLFPLLQCFESSWPSAATSFGLLAEMVQMAALIINPLFPWGGIVQGIAIPTYFSIIPVWDQSYDIALPFVNGSILFWIAIAVLAAFVCVCAVLSHLISEQLDRHGQDLGKLLVHLITATFFLPMLHLMLAYSVCDQNTNFLLAFTEQGCLSSSYNTVLFALAVVGMATLVFLKIVTTLLLFDDHPASLHLRARPHNMVEIAMIALQITSSVLFHFLPSSGMLHVFAGVYALGCAVVAGLHVFYLPFFRQSVNVFRVVTLSCIAYASMVAAVILEENTHPAANKMLNWNSLVLGGGGIGVVILSTVLASFRISSACQRDLDAAANGERSASPDRARFPSNLPEEERNKLRENESIMLGEARYARTQESLTGPQQEREDQRDDLWVCSPYLDSVYVVTDVEVATRHIFQYAHLTGLRPPATMMAMGLRIYTKGISRFPDSHWLSFQFATFLCALAPQRNQVALTLCDRILRAEDTNVVLAYRVFRRAQGIATSMFLRDSAHKKSFVSAQQMHREALVNMRLFWGKLLADQVDIVQLGSLAKVITERREEGLKYFERVVNESNDIFSLIRYAQFLEQVMMDTEAANNARESVLDSLEQEQLGIARDTHTRQAVIGATRQRGTSISRSRTISSLNFNIHFIFSLLVAIIVGGIIFGVVIYQQRLDEANKLQSAGMARSLSQEALVYTNLIAVSQTATQRNAYLVQLERTLTNFRNYHSQITHGPYKTTFSEVADVLAAPGAELTVAHTLQSGLTMGLWELGVTLASALETIVTASSTDAARQYAIQLVQDNALNNVGRLYNDSVTAYSHESAVLLHAGQYTIIALYLAALAILLVVYFVLIFNFRMISSSKLSTLSLFTLIPKNALEKLMQEGKDRIDNFDKPDEKFEALKVQRGLEDDHDAMKQVIAIDDDNNSDGHHHSGETSSVTGAGGRGGGGAGGANGQQGGVGGGNGGAGGGGKGGDLGDDSEDLDLHGKFATLLKNSSVGDTGKMKLVHHGQYETPYPKDMWVAPQESAEEIRERQRVINELRVEDDLRALRESSSAAGGTHGANGAASSGSNGGDASDLSDSSSTHHSGGGGSGEVKSGPMQTLVSFATQASFVLCIVLGALFIAGLSSNTSQSSSLVNAETRLNATFGFYTAVERQRNAAELLLFSPASETYENLLRALSVEQPDTLAEVALAGLRLQSAFNAMFSAQSHYRVLLKQLLILVRIVCEAEGLTCTEVRTATEGWDATAFLPPKDLRLYDNDQSIDPPFTPSALAMLSPSSRVALCRKKLSSQYYRYLASRMAQASGDAVDELQSDLASELSADAIRGYRYASAELAVAATLLVFLFVTSVNSPSLPLRFVGGVVIILACAAVVLGLAGHACSQSTSTLSDTAGRAFQMRVALNQSLALSNVIHGAAQRIVFNADALAAVNIDAAGGDAALEASWGVLESLVLSDGYTKLLVAFDQFRRMGYLDLIAAALGCVANGLYAPPSLGLWWNASAEVYLARTMTLFPSQVLYTTRPDDLALAAPAQLQLASHLFHGPLYRHFSERASVEVSLTAHASIDQLHHDALDHVSSMRRFLTAGAAVSFGGAFVALLLMLHRLFEYVESVNVTRMGESAAREDELFERLTRQSQVALSILALVFTALFIFTIVDYSKHEKRSIDQNHASLREFYYLRSMAQAQLGVNRSWYSQRAVRDASLLYEDLGFYYYGGHSENTQGILSDLSSSGATMSVQALFGDSASDPVQGQRFRCDAAAATTAANLAGNETLQKALSNGVDMALRTWVSTMYVADQVSPASTRSLWLTNKSTDFASILEQCRAQSQQYTDVATTAAAGGLIGFLVILLVTLLGIVATFIFVFRPMIGQLLNEEEGTKVMLKMIPVEVRESVPAIAEYLETGVVLQDMKMHEVNEAAADLSTIPTITIDAQGVIVKFSRAAEDQFLWTKGEVLGQNVKLLMPENIATEHDAYLARYRKTGVKTIIGRTRKIRARRKDGTLFPAEILVREIRNGRNTLFVGQLRNITVEIEFERAIVLSKAVSEAATVPIVVINSKGVIQRFNAAAEETFKCGQEVVGKKVNLLMPQADAELHDSYLDRYLKTGIKTVIDLKRHVRAKKLTGELFPARLNIRELKRGSDSIFIGYIEDMTKQVHLQMASMVSEAIMSTSPVPIVAIDDVGTIISWSPQAAHTFGHLPQDALGKNVKFIMPDTIAARHDGYLQTFQKTGRTKMIGNVTLQKAKRREEDGSTTIFPVRIAVKDITQQGKNNYFVAFIQDVSKQQQLETEYKISSSITDLSTLPLVTIDAVGQVKAFSKAAEVCFGYGKAEVVGNNVTMLMPERYRANHPGYLERYFQTGTKTVIDIIRHVEGITKSGREFPIALMVREVKHDGRYNFVGYIRDISNDSKMAEANAYNDAISQLAVVPILSINMEGIILSCSDSTCDRFLWSRDELVGQNISVLMPESVGVKHDGYLKKYKQRLATSGVERARETSTLLHRERFVTARTRDEQQFQAAVHVRDLHIDGTAPIFVGYIRDMTDEVNQSTQRTIADAIVSLSSIPLICINAVGTITVFSHAAEKDFGYSAQEVIGKNVKLLQPEDVATKHDGYLKAYAKTGIKTVIDSRRQVQARKKSGLIFSVEIMVKEVVQKDAAGRDLVEFIGFVRDLTQQFILLQANTINDVVSQLATVPIVIIDIRGSILDFNGAASREFGYRPEEVHGKNIKLLMPDDVAIQHDSYLARYRATRKKNIIDSTRRLSAKRRNGELFSCEISVREVVKEGTEGQYIGYIRDVSHEQLLVKQHKVNSAIIDLSTTPIVVIDIKGEISIFSRAAEEVFGYTRKEVEGQNVKMLMPKDVADRHDGFLSAYARTRVKNIIDTSRRVRALRKRGTTFPAEISVREITGSDGQSIFIGYLSDCTTETQLSAAAAFSECVNALSPVPIIAINHIGTIVRFSAAAEEEFGVKAETIIGLNIKTLQPPEVASVHDEYLAKYLRTGIKTIIGQTRAIQCKRWDGTMFHAEITTREVKNLHDPTAPPTYVGYLRNIETQLKIEEAFKEGNAMLELAPVPVISISLRGIIIDVNPASCAAFGYSQSELVGKNIKMLMPPSVAQHHDSYLANYLTTRVKNVIDSLRHVVAQRKNGSQFHVEIAVREIHVEGMENMYIGYIRDVTEDLKMAEAVNLNEAVNSLSSTPLVVIDPIGTILKFSQAAEDLFGYTSAEVLDKNVKMLMPQSVAIKHDRYLEVYKATGKKNIVDSSRQTTAKRKDGSTFPVEIGVREVLTEDKKSTAVFVGYIRSLDESVLQVGQSAEINAMMMELATQGVIIIDHLGCIERVNGAVLEMFGIPDKDTIVGKNIKMLMPDAIAEKHDGYLETYYRTRVKHVIDSTRQVSAKMWGTKDKTFPIEIAVKEILERGKEVRFLGYVRHIAKDLEMQTVRRTSAAALDLSPYATVVIDAKGTMLMFSRAAEAMFETTAKEMIGKNVKILMPADIAAHHDDYLATYRRTGEKHVIDSARTISAKSVATGRLFLVTLQIKECTFSIKGLESVFLGYISLKE